MPNTEEFIIPEPQGIGNLEDLPDDAEIEANTPKAQVDQLQKAKNLLKIPNKDGKSAVNKYDENMEPLFDEDMDPLPKIQEIS